jgi:hypothetical protein
MTFQEIGLNDDLLKAVTDLGFTTPTPIQNKQLLEAVESSRDREGVIRWAMVSENEFLTARSKCALQIQYRLLTKYTKDEVARI